jgi:hypothetical protein
MDKIERVWAMPSADTFDCSPIGSLVKRYLSESRMSVDPFARNKRWALITNDLNPTTNAHYHMDALDFLALLYSQGIRADLVLFDPPYSLRQMKEDYENIGRSISGRESQRFYGDVRDAIDRLVIPGGIVISFGWNSIGMGKTRDYEIQEILMVCHGRAHNDTIVTVDKKRGASETQEELI